MKYLPIVWGAAGLAMLWTTTAAIADVNILYTDPSGGWAYSYLGEGDNDILSARSWEDPPIQLYRNLTR